MSFPISPYIHQYLLSSFFISQFSSVQSFSHVQCFVTHGLQHIRLHCPSPTPRACSNSYSSVMPSIISSSVVLFPSRHQSFPASGSFPVSPFFISGGQNIGPSVSASVLPMDSRLISFRSDWFDLLAAQGTLKCLPQHHSSKASILWCSAFVMVQSHIHTRLLEKP